MLSVVIACALVASGCVAPQAEPLDRADNPPAGEPVAPGWAPLDLATIRPGTPLALPGGASCPTNFLFARPDNGTLFLGTTAHCLRDYTVGAVFSIGAPENIAVVIYHSYQTMAELGESDRAALENNDFAVVMIDSSSRDQVNPTPLVGGGPTGLADGAGFVTGHQVVTRAATPEQPDWRDGVITSTIGDWALLVHHAPPILPGGMGGAVLTPQGEAVGHVISLVAAPEAGANAVARLDTVMAYAAEHANLDMSLVPWSYEASAPVSGP